MPKPPSFASSSGGAILMLIVAMFSIQLGASLAKGLFSVMGASGAAAMRIFFATLFLVLLLPPWKIRLNHSNWGPLLLYGIALGGMNISIYQAIQRIPLGIAVAIEFIGPLGVAIGTSRRMIDLIWAILALGGLVLLTPWGTADQTPDLIGVGFAALAGLFWGIYIIVGKRAAQNHGATAVSAGMVIAMAMTMPVGLASAGMSMFTLSAIPTIMAIALLSSAFPYALEIVALRRLPSSAYGTLMSLEPAVGALAGAALLHERLPVLHWVAMAAIMLASAGATWSSSRTATRNRETLRETTKGGDCPPPS